MFNNQPIPYSQGMPQGAIAGYMINGYFYPATTGLGELTDKEVLDITTNYFNSLSATELYVIVSELTSKKFDRLSYHVRQVAEKICTAGASDKITTFLKNNSITIGLTLVSLIGVYFLSRKKSKKK